MQRSKLSTLFDVALHIVVNQHRLFEILAAVSNAVTHCLYLGDALDNTVYRVNQRLHDHVYANRMIRDVEHHLVIILAGWFMGQYTISDTDSFKKPFCQHPGAVLHVKQLIFD